MTQVAEEKAMVPELRFSEFDQNWKFDRVDEFCPLQRGFDLPVKDIQEGEYPVVFSNGILKTHSQYKAKAPGVVTGRSGTIGNITFVEKDYWPHNTSLWVTDFKENYPRFIYYFLSQLKLDRFGTGSGVPTLNRNDVHAYKTAIPKEEEEQQKIASFLTAVDEKLGQLCRKRDCLKTYKRGVMQKIFSQDIRFSQDDGSAFPDWEERKISDIFEVTRGYVLAMTKTLEEPKGEYIYPVYSSQTKANGLAGFYDEYLYENAITWTTDGANAGETKFREGKFYCTNVCGVMINTEGYANSFVAEVINSISRRYVSYVGNPKLMNNVMASIKVNLPCVEEQEKIASFLSAVDTKIDAMEQKISEIETFKKGLLQKMFV